MTLSTSEHPQRQGDPWADAIASAEEHVRAGRPATAAGESEGDPSGGRKLLFVVAGVLVATAVAFGVREVARPEPPSLAAASQSADLRREAVVLIEQIEAYRTERGELPAPSLLSPYLEEGYEYYVVDDAAGEYVVRRTAGGVTVTYDGSLPLGLWTLLGGRSGGGTP